MKKIIRELTSMARTTLYSISFLFSEMVRDKMEKTVGLGIILKSAYTITGEIMEALFHQPGEKIVKQIFPRNSEMSI